MRVLVERVCLVVGARPNFVKAYPLLRAFSEEGMEVSLVNTGQHYDAELCEVFFDELRIRDFVREINLKVGSGSHAEQTSRCIIQIERVLQREKPDVTVVIGDVNSTLAGALASIKIGIPVAHVEAGYRSFDLGMPEEVNRILVDHISQLLFSPTESSTMNLMIEGIPEDRIRFSGNVLIDSLVSVCENLGITPKNIDKEDYAVLTIHRPKNVDNPNRLREIVDAAKEIPIRVVFPIHPRTRERCAEFRVDLEGIEVRYPMGYMEFISLLARAKLVLTDSGGIQEEALFLGTPCLTLRENTERIETLISGGNLLVGANRERIIRVVSELLEDEKKYESMVKAEVPDRWDGKASKRVASELGESEMKIQSYNFMKMGIPQYMLVEKRELSKEDEVIAKFSRGYLSIYSFDTALVRRWRAN